MAREVKEIQNQILSEVQADPVLGSKLTSPSKAAIYRLWSFITAGAMYILEVLFDRHREEMDILLLNQHAHTLTWYEERAREFLFGKDLIPFTRQYDTTGMTPEEIEEAKIISYAACSREQRENGRIYIRIKIAKGEEERAPLSATELRAFQNYISNIQDAGVDLECLSPPGDQIRMTWRIYYDPQVLDSNGNRIDASEAGAIRNAIVEYLKQLPFNGLYVPAFHTDFLQKVEGVKVPVIDSVKISTDSGAHWQDIPDDGLKPGAGWCKFYDEEELQVEMIPFKYGENV